MMDVAVLGCGPAGLLAAHAATQAGHDVVIYSVKALPSKIGGAQYLHVPIPELTRQQPDGEVQVKKLGDAEGYATKVYGNSQAPTSWNLYPAGYMGVWNMQQAYYDLWQLYGHRIREQNVDSTTLPWLALAHDVVLSCVPAIALCRGGHTFAKQEVVIKPSASPIVGDGVIVYNGDPADDWYRTSRIFGHAGTEYPTPHADVPQGLRIAKPLWNDCNCYSELPLVRLGRYGQWKKGELIHDAYRGAARYFEECGASQGGGEGHDG